MKPGRRMQRACDRDRPMSAKYEVSDRLQLEVSVLDAGSEPELAGAIPSSDRLRAVLIVDDEAEMRAYVGRCLKVTGFALLRVQEASDGVEALEELASGPVDLVISDIVMPRMDGYTLCARLSADAELREIPVLLISGEDEIEEIRRRMPAAPRTNVLAKPFSARMLRDAIENLWRTIPPA